MNEKVTVIAGAGVMGISTALAVRRKHPDHTIYIINDGQQSIKPASEDIGKIIRDAYNEEVYAKLAAEATKLFQSEPIYEDLLHQSGWVVLHPSAEEQSITGGPLSISKADFLKRFPGTRLDNINRISEDPKIAWVEASKALQATVDLVKTSEITLEDCTSVKSARVILKESQVVDLLWDGSICAGVILGNGIEIRANSVLLAMGHETTSFLEQCKLPDMGGERVGISLLGIQLTDEQYNKYKGIPILLVPGVGQIFPPNKEKIMKISNSRSFRVPDLSVLKAQYPLTATSPYFNDNLKLLSWLLPELKDCQTAFYRYCLDCVTRTQDFCISPVAGRIGLYVAFGGSFHLWKFLTNIGNYVVRMMDGDETFYEEWKRWTDHSGLEVLVHSEIIPKRSFPNE